MFAILLNSRSVLFSASKKYTHLFLASVLLMLAVFMLFPFYKYYVDPDGTSYLTIAKRYASGDFKAAVNGYWSPWSCWLVAGFIKLGWGAEPASILVNTVGGLGFLVISRHLFRRFSLPQWYADTATYAIAFFLCFAIYWQTFDDLWECFFLLLSLYLYIKPGFFESKFNWVLAGIIGALAFLSKAYAFPYFVILTLCSLVLIYGLPGKKTVLCAVSILGVMVVVSLPWLIALHNKYGIWTTSTSGSLNLSWYLVGHPHWKNEIKLLLPPVYPDSPYYWEDPWFANGDTSFLWSSWKMFGLGCMRLVLTCYKFLVSQLQIAVFFPVVFIFGLYALINSKLWKTIELNYKLLIMAFLLFPAGYLLINFESRYIWFMLPPAMILGFKVLEQYTKWRSNRVVMYLFLMSFLVYPAWQMAKLFNEGKHEYELAQKITALHINGSFTSNRRPVFMARLAWFTGNTYYYNAQPDLLKSRLVNAGGNVDSLVGEIKRYHIRYFLYFKGREGDDYLGQDFKNNQLFISSMKQLMTVDDAEIFEVRE